MRNTQTRLRRLEAALSRSRVVVVQGTDEEHDAKIAAVKASGQARDGDLIIYVRKFSDPAAHRGVQA